MSVLATDTFNRANEGPLASPWAGRGGTSGDQAFNLTSNAANPSELTDDHREWYDGSISWPNDQYTQAKLTVSGTGGGGQGIGLTLRGSTSATTFYRFVIDHAGSNNWAIGLFSAGSSTPLANGTQAFSNGDTFKMLIVGTTITVSLNGAAAFATTSDGTIASGKPGLGYSSTETSASVDDWEGGDTFIPAKAVVVRQAVKRAAYY